MNDTPHYSNSPKNKLLVWTIRHRFGLLVALIVAYFILGPAIRRKLEFARRDETPVESGGTTQDASNNQNSSAQMILSDPQSQNADPKWAALAGLNSDELRQFASETDRVATNWHHKNYLRKCQAMFLGSLSMEEVKNSIWTGMRDNTLKDQTLASDWTKAVKKVYDPVEGVGALELGVADFFSHDIINSRFSAVQANIMGGTVLVGDVGFIKTFGVLTDHALSTLTNEVPDLEGIASRVITEFPDKFSKNMADVPKEDPNSHFE